MRLQLVECFMHGEEFVVFAGGGGDFDLMHVHMLGPGAVFGGLAAAGAVDEDARMASAAAAKKWARFSKQARPFSSTSRSQASWTSAVGWSVCAACSRFILARAIWRSSS